MLQLENVSQLSAQLAATPFDLISVISFERRATSWVEHLATLGLTPQNSMVFDYDTVADPIEVDKKLREQCREQFSRYLTDWPTSLIANANAFAINSLRGEMLRRLSLSAASTVLFDITCMTRVHLFAAMSAALTTRDSGKRIIFLYASAAGYGHAKQDLQGWRDVLFVAASEASGVEADSRRFGVISAGSDGERLSVALQELEPQSGVMIYTDNEDRPDFSARTFDANEIVRSRLIRLRGPLSASNGKIDNRWRFENIRPTDLTRLYTCVDQQIGYARSAQGVLTIYPFGPKPVTLCIAHAALRSRDVPAWVVYPIPERFSVTYSSGVGRLYAYGLTT